MSASDRTTEFSLHMVPLDMHEKYEESSTRINELFHSNIDHIFFDESYVVLKTDEVSWFDNKSVHYNKIKKLNKIKVNEVPFSALGQEEIDNIVANEVLHKWYYPELFGDDAVESSLLDLLSVELLPVINATEEGVIKPIDADLCNIPYGEVISFEVFKTLFEQEDSIAPVPIIVTVNKVWFEDTHIWRDDLDDLASEQENKFYAKTDLWYYDPYERISTPEVRKKNREKAQKRTDTNSKRKWSHKARGDKPNKKVVFEEFTKLNLLNQEGVIE